MTDFDGLLPPRRPAPPLPVPTSPRTIVAAARGRRRMRAMQVVSAGSALSLGFTALLALRPTPALHGITPDQSATKSPASVSSWAASSPPVANSGEPAPARPEPVPSAGRAGAGPATRGTPPAWLSASPSPSPTSPPPASAGPRPPRAAHTRIDRRFVPDPDPGNNCVVETATGRDGATAVICTRTFAPETVRPGQPVRFVYQACAYGAGDQTIRFAGAAEAEMFITRSGASRTWWDSQPQRGGAAHDLVIPARQCAEYTIHWDGRANDGGPLEPETYLAVSRLIGYGGPIEISSDEFTVV